MIVHIGYHKTGTTFLQKNVFPFIQGVDYIDYEKCKIIFENVISNTTIEFADATFDNFVKSGKALYSSEGLVGYMGRGDYNYGIAKRLKHIGFKKIIITIRRQDEMVESLYRQCIQQGGTINSKKFIENTDLFKWSFLDYEKLISHYVNLFGLENILVIPQEQLKSNLALSISQLRKFCSSDKINFRKSHSKSNISLSFYSIKLLKILNHFTYNHYKMSHLISKKISTSAFRTILQKVIDPYFIRKLVKDKDFYNNSFKKEIRKTYSSCNIKLSEMFDLDLNEYGYFEESKANII